MSTEVIVVTKQELTSLIKNSLREILSESHQSQPTVVSALEILNVKQVADLLNLSVPTIYHQTSMRIIPHFKKGKRLYFKRSEIEYWIAEGKVKTQAEIEVEASTYIVTGRHKKQYAQQIKKVP